MYKRQPPIGGWDKVSEVAADTYPELIADVEKVEADWFRRSGIYPIHGLIVVKDEHIKRHPWLARSLMNAFIEAKKPYLEQLKRDQGDNPEDKRYRNFLSLMSDPLPYGIAANRPSIEALVTYSLQQELIPSRPQLDQAVSYTHLDVYKRQLGDRVVAAFGQIFSLEIAAAHMHADRHRRRCRGNRIAKRLDIEAGQSRRIVAVGGHALAHDRVAQHGKRDFVELNVTAAGGGQRGDLGAIDRG